ncbi:MAG TPA: hypothetical protein VFG83_14860 [Kofleriaceae bacterium]|nr:hypothetical protein [Kofleriaceae bacterium]
MTLPLVSAPMLGSLRLRPTGRLVCAVALFVVGSGAGCGSEIGDECTIPTDCSPQGDRICDTTAPAGYCTVAGCDYDTCPEEAVCVRFFSVVMTDLPCDPRAEDITTNDCTADEICTLAGTCAPLTAESRYCMRTCSSDSDCRERYECRTEADMMDHGGQPVAPPGEPLPDNLQRFCAPEEILPESTVAASFGPPVHVSSPPAFSK